jgi:hypothetical protein
MKFKSHENLTRIIGTLHEDQYTSVTISRSVLLRMRNVSGKICRKNQNTRFFENRAVYDILWRSIVELDKPHDNRAHALCTMDN